MARLKSGNYQTNKAGIIHTVAFSNSDQLLVSGSADKTIRIWDLQG